MSELKSNLIIFFVKVAFLLGWRPVRAGFQNWEVNRYIADNGERPQGASGLEVFRDEFVWLYVEVLPMYAEANKTVRARARMRKLNNFVFRLLRY